MALRLVETMRFISLSGDAIFGGKPFPEKMFYAHTACMFATMRPTKCR